MRVDISLAALAGHCVRHIDTYRTLGECVDTGIDRFYVHIDNGASVLAIAHLDTALNHYHAILDGKTIISPSLDDRLGVYVILDVLPSLGLKYDILLTTDEEIGLSTASDFDTDKQYNWMFSLDRRGTDVVLYDYHNADTVRACRVAGWQVGIGTYSDIAMCDIGCVGFNFGIGYHLEHTRKCYAHKSVVERQVKRFIRFYRKHCRTLMPYDGYLWTRADTLEWSDDMPYGHSVKYQYIDGHYVRVDRDTSLSECAWCGMPLFGTYVRFGYGVCIECAEYIDRQDRLWDN